MSSGVFITRSATISYLTSHVSEGRSLASGLYYMGYYGGGSGAWACALMPKANGLLDSRGLILVVQLIALGVVTLFMRNTRLVNFLNQP